MWPSSTDVTVCEEFNRGQLFSIANTFGSHMHLAAFCSFWQVSSPHTNLFALMSAIVFPVVSEMFRMSCVNVGTYGSVMAEVYGGTSDPGGRFTRISNHKKIQQ